MEKQWESQKFLCVYMRVCEQVLIAQFDMADMKNHKYFAAELNVPEQAYWL